MLAVRLADGQGQVTGVELFGDSGALLVQLRSQSP